MGGACGYGGEKKYGGETRMRDRLAFRGVDTRIILKCILKKQDGRVWTELIWLRIGITGGLF